MVPGIRQIFQYIRSYYANHFSFGYLLATALLLGTLLYQNYTGPGLVKLFPDKVLPPWLSGYLLYAIPFFTAYLLQPFFFKNLRYQFKKWFWILLFLAPAFFAFRVELDLAVLMPAYNWKAANSFLNFYNASLFFKAVALMLPAALCWYCMDGAKRHGYGLKKTANLPAYLLLICLMLPLITLASFSPSFLHQYPRALQAIGNQHNASLGSWLGFELVYAFDFLSIEFFFRAFLILAFLRLSGPQAIIPAACFYCCIHLEKPLAEAISSFFGGWLLGIICYYSKSIWGGLIIHIGTAWLMELFAWLQQH
jgi:hypothetical protein